MTFWGAPVCIWTSVLVRELIQFGTFESGAQDVFNKMWPSLSKSSAAGEEDQCVSSMTERDSTEKMGQLRPQGPSGVSQTAYSAAITEEGVRCPLCSPCPSPKYHFLCTESWDLPSFSYATVCLKRPARLKWLDTDNTTVSLYFTVLSHKGPNITDQ